MSGRHSLVALAVGLALAGQAQAQLLITEYLEGSGNNKAVELSNLGSDAVDLSQYRLALYANGKPITDAPTNSLALQGTQQQAAEWGGDPAQMVLLGHSAGAHLVALLNADLAASTRLGIQPWRGAVLLDSTVLDLPAIMRKSHYRFYDQAFGTEPAYWRQLSPLHQLQEGAPPVLAVCSSQRPDQPCAQASAFADSMQRLGSRAEVLPQPLSHKAINHELGLDNAYTRQVEVFLASLGAGLQQRLQPRNDNGPDKPGR